MTPKAVAQIERIRRRQAHLIGSTILTPDQEAVAA
jgi:hypothetical protein